MEGETLGQASETPHAVKGVGKRRLDEASRLIEPSPEVILRRVVTEEEGAIVIMRKGLIRFTIRVLPLLLALLAASIAFAWMPLARSPRSNRETMPPRHYDRPRSSISLAAVGDILLDRLPGARYAKNGSDYLLRAVRPELAGADLALGNLESPLSATARKRLGDANAPIFCAKPESLSSLAWAGFDYVSLANNHACDALDQGISDTRKTLAEFGIACSGAGKDEVEARKAALLEIGGWRLALLSYGYADGQSYAAGPSRPGIADLSIDKIRAGIARARLMDRADFVVVSIHWGEEYRTDPSRGQLSMGRACVDAGATIVLGYHPHVLQGIERRGRGLIFYSLGNFVFDQGGDETSRGLIAVIRLGEGGIQGVRLVPIELPYVTCAPRPASDEKARLILGALGERSARLGTPLRIGASQAWLD